MALKLSFEHNFGCEDLFSGERFRWDSRLFLREMDQKTKICGTIDYGDSYLEFLFRLFKEIRLHAFLHGADEAMRHIVVKI